MSEGRRIEIQGTVQGVGFRPWVYRLACETGVTGSVCNHAAGVTIEAFGSKAQLVRFERRLRAESPPAARVRKIRTQPLEATPSADFAILPSSGRRETRVSIPADRATCEACLSELRDPNDRRYEYPFTNCTDCGPRFTISLRAPYDRRTTTMQSFPLCADCLREYEDPTDRRFHAEPNACPRCGPRLSLVDGSQRPVKGVDPIRGAAAALARGSILAVKGLGGFHLACDATSSEAVKRLRERKGRDEKPFAVMVADLDAARRLACLDAEEARLLQAFERPIVLVTRRSDPAEPPVCEEVAPNLPLLGLMLPYTPLHHLLLEAVGRPLVMTSGNRSDEPIAYRNAEALQRLHGLADAFLLHDREIASRCDDSVARIIDARPVVLRRARGYVPRPVAVARPFVRPVLACGGHLKNAICIGVGDVAYLGPHVGDLETLEAYEAFQDSVHRMQRFLGVEPEWIAHDLHPDYLSTRYARERLDGVKIGVQHHHAHVASALAEHGEEGPALGLAWDGTGCGEDGSAWGGELLLADAAGFDRLATFRPLRLAGGERAIREPWRIALAWLTDAFDGAPPLTSLSLFERIAGDRLQGVQRMLARGVNAPSAHGVGRYFDAAGALVLGRPVARYEGQVALEWNLVAARDEHGAYPFELQTNLLPWQIDLRATARAVVRDLGEGAPAARISARFHETLARAADTVVRAAARRHGRRPVVLSGGCFQNRRLCEDVVGRLASDFRVLTHGEVPPGDGGLALGQARVANARLARGGSSRCA